MGVYETYRGDTVEIVEERGPRCADPAHEEGRVTRDSEAGRRPVQHVA